LRSIRFKTFNSLAMYTFRYKLLYFVQFSCYGVLSPYLPIFFESLSVSKSRIGILTMLPNICAFLIGPIFGYIGKFLLFFFFCMAWI
jgi:hypothetical protein